MIPDVEKKVRWFLSAMGRREGIKKTLAKLHRDSLEQTTWRELIFFNALH